jgi:hypothetical protein
MLLAPGSLRSAWAKVCRAEEHRQALESYIDETFAVEANLPRLGAKFDEETGEHVLYVNRMPDLTDFLSRARLILGDAVNNLRSALDHTAFQLALLNTHGHVRNERAVKFPITSSAERFAKESTKALAEVHPNHVAIIERCQPYQGVNGHVALESSFHPLAVLHSLSNMDKHRLLPTVFLPPSSLKGITGLGVVILLAPEPDRFVESLLAFEDQPLKTGAEASRIKLVDRLIQEEVDMAGHVVPQVSLTQGRPVVSVVQGMTAVVIKLIREFEQVP